MRSADSGLGAGVLAALTSTVAPASLRAVGIATTQTVVASARFVSLILFGVLWTVVGRGVAVSVFAGLPVAVVPAAWWLLRGLTPEGEPSIGRVPGDQ